MTVTDAIATIYLECKLRHLVHSWRYNYDTKHSEDETSTVHYLIHPLEERCLREDTVQAEYCYC